MSNRWIPSHLNICFCFYSLYIVTSLDYWLQHRSYFSLPQKHACAPFTAFNVIGYPVGIWLNNKSTQRVFNASKGMHIDYIITILFAKHSRWKNIMSTWKGFDSIYLKIGYSVLMKLKYTGRWSGGKTKFIRAHIYFYIQTIETFVRKT